MSNHPVAAGIPCPAMTEPHLSPQAYERLRDELDERTGERRREISLADRTRPRARRHQRERRLRRGQERAGPQRGARPPARADAEERGRHRGRDAGDVVEPGVLVELQLRRRRRRRHVPRRLDRGAQREVRRALDESPLGQALLGAAPGRDGDAIRARSASCRSPSSPSAPSTDCTKRSDSTDPPLQGGSTRCRRSVARNSSCNSGGSDSYGDTCERWARIAAQRRRCARRTSTIVVMSASGVPDRASRCSRRSCRRRACVQPERVMLERTRHIDRSRAACVRSSLPRLGDVGDRARAAPVDGARDRSARSARSARDGSLDARPLPAMRARRSAGRDRGDYPLATLVDGDQRRVRGIG